MFSNNYSLQSRELRRRRLFAIALSSLLCLGSVGCLSSSAPSEMNRSRSSETLRFRKLLRTPQAEDVSESPLDLPSNLGALVKIAAANSPAVRVAQASFEASLERAPQVEGLPNPTLRGKYFVEEVQTRVGPQEWAVGVEQKFPAIGVLDSRGKAATAQSDAQLARLDLSIREVVREVRLAWHELYYLGRAVESVREECDRLTSLEEVILRDYASGSIPYTVLIRAQVELGRSENRLAGLQDQLRPAAARLNAVLHRPNRAAVPTPGVLKEPGQLLSTEKLLELMEAASPLLASLRHEKRAAEETRRGAELESRPAYSLGLEYIATGSAIGPGVSGSGDDPLVATFSIDLPIHKNRYNAAKREARALSHKASFTFDSTLDRLRSQLEQEHFIARDAQRQVSLYEDTLLPRARQAFEATETAFRSGQVNFLELIDAERLLLEFDLTLERARTDRALAHARLEALVGTTVTTPTQSPTELDSLDSQERSQ